MAKVIDALVVTLGLDPSSYKKGMDEAKAAEADLKKTAQSEATTTQTSAEKTGKVQKALAVEKRKQAAEEKKLAQERERRQRESQTQEARNTEASIGRLKSLGLAAAGLVLGFESVKGAMSAYFSATNQLATLGRVAPTVGIDVKSLDVLGDMYQKVGGNAQDAAGDIAKLAHAQFSFAVNAPDAMAGWLRRLGVGLFDTKTGQARSKEDIQEDIARSLKAKTKDLQTQAMYAREMGLSEAFIQIYLVKSAAERAKMRKESEATAKADEASAKAAQTAEQARARLGQHIKGAKEQVSSAIARVEAPVENIVSDALDTGDYAGAIRKLFAGYKRRVTANMLAGDFQAAEKKNNLPPGFLASVAAKESGFNADAVSPAGARGIMQIMPGTFANAGKDPVTDIYKAGEILGKSYQLHLRQGFSPDVAKKMALEDYNAGTGKADKVRKGVIDRATGRPTQFKPETLNYPGSILNNTTRFNNEIAPVNGGRANMQAGMSGAITNTHIDQINVYTKATDAKGIAAELPDAIKNQGIVAQANTGQF